MSALTTFDSTKEALSDMLKSIKDGTTQLPDFQRGWVWDDQHIRSLLASVSLSYPIGAVMMLQTGNPDVRFKPRPVEGISLATPCEPDRLILDGQQRLTSLFLALYANQPVQTRDVRGNNIRRWYYIDTDKALAVNGDREEAIIAVPEDLRVRNFRNEVTADYSTREKECAAGLFPLSLVFDITGLFGWQAEYFKAGSANQERWNRLFQEIIQPFQQYQMPLILLRKETPKEAVCQVFEKVNTGGVSLTAFELLTATYAADNYNLRDDWAEREKRLRQRKVLQSLENTDFLQTVTLLAPYARKALNPDVAVTCKRRDVLRLTLKDYCTWAEPATQGYEKAAKFLHAHKFFAARDLPYRTQLVPIAAILAVLGDKADNDGVHHRIARWYWCGVFGELYGSATETRFAKDFPEVLSWIDGGPEPDTLNDANFAPARLSSLRTRNSAAYKGIYALLLRDGVQDFRSGIPTDQQMYFDERIDIHHIFPKDFCVSNGIPPGDCDSVVNKTPLSARTNRTIGGNAPSIYLERLQKSAEIPPERMDTILRSHLIEPDAIRSDDFDAFFATRQNALLDRIEKAMGKPVARDAVLPIAEEPAEYQEDDIDAELAE